MTEFMELFLKGYIYKYAFEIVAVCAMFFAVLPKRKKWYLVAIPVIAAMLYGSSFWNGTISGVKGVRVLRYLLLTVGAYLGVWGVYRVKPLTAFYCLMLGVTCQHLAVSVHNIVNTIFSFSVLDLGNLIGYFIVTPLTYGSFYFFAIKSCKKMNLEELKNRGFLFVGSGIIIIVFVFSQLRSGELNRGDLILIHAYDLISCLFGWYLLTSVSKNDRLEKEVLTLREFMDKEERQMQLIQENVELVNIKCHDIKQQLSLYKEKIEQEELKKIENLIEIYDSDYKTGNEYLNVILSEKSLICKQHEITLTCMANGEKLAFLSSVDIYSIFGNALDNAIRAVDRIANPDQRVISLTVNEGKGMIAIHIENYYEGEIAFSDGIPLTTKNDKQYHGFGFKSILYTVERHGGSYTVETKDGIFALNILLPI